MMYAYVEGRNLAHGFLGFRIGRQYMTDSYWIITIPGVALMITVLGLNLLGDGLRDVLDPRLRIQQ